MVQRKREKQRGGWRKRNNSVCYDDFIRNNIFFAVGPPEERKTIEMALLAQNETS